MLQPTVFLAPAATGDSTPVTALIILIVAAMALLVVLTFLRASAARKNAKSVTAKKEEGHNDAQSKTKRG